MEERFVPTRTTGRDATHERQISCSGKSFFASSFPFGERREMDACSRPHWIWFAYISGLRREKKKRGEKRENLFKSVVDKLNAIVSYLCRWQYKKKKKTKKKEFVYFFWSSQTDWLTINNNAGAQGGTKQGKLKLVPLPSALANIMQLWCKYLP